MGIIRLISKLTGVEKKVKWSRCKRIKIDGPEFWGRYEVFVDNVLDVAFFLPKRDYSIHVLTGNVIEASHHKKFASSGELLSDDTLPQGGIEWKINPTRVLFRGHGLPPGQTIYEGKVISDDVFHGKITDSWIAAHVHELQTQIRES